MAAVVLDCRSVYIFRGRSDRQCDKWGTFSHVLSLHCRQFTQHSFYTGRGAGAGYRERSLRCAGKPCRGALADGSHHLAGLACGLLVVTGDGENAVEIVWAPGKRACRPRTPWHHPCQPSYTSQPVTGATDHYSWSISFAQRQYCCRPVSPPSRSPPAGAVSFQSI